ncbi:MAG: hypothetical protein ACE37F_06025 [Nannocystaceae bacterium]|nr:hypothetical protein [bacterium]
MKRNSTLCALLLTIPLHLSMSACDVDKEDGLDTGAVGDDEDIDEDEDEDEDENEDSGGSSSAGTGDSDDSDDGDDSAGTGKGSGGDDSDSDDSAGTGAGGGEADGVALLHGELPDIDIGDTGAGSGSDGDSGFPDDALLVILDNDGSATCDDPWAASECGGNWSISFTLLPEQMEPGTYALFDLNGSFSFADEPHPEGDCPFGGGTLDGTLVIEAIDDDAVVGHIEDADAWDFDANVSFVAPRC